MIHLIDVCKTYRVKKGPEVKALDHVNLTFGEKGLVFILGKSGAGKSTLLNVVGGLDRIDSGDIVIMGKSSKDFTQAEFDSYRNTYLGFIFQEYNILPTFTIGQNIALALQLQGQKSTNEEVDAILDQVDLHGLRDRKPNELSGGQKQRVAIARALIKKPQIIMADEPTGALDSKTGQDIFNTLKKLAQDHLVICVSHDRDFAESFGDRVIEMKDGKVISDITKSYVETEKVAVGVEVLSPRLISFQKGHVLTEEDVTLLNKYLASADHEMLVSSDDAINTNVKAEAKIDVSGKKGTFNETTPESVGAKEYKNSEFALKKSRLPFARSLKMAFTSLRSKPFRLVATVLLSIVSFSMLGIAASTLTYNRESAFVETAQGLKMQSLTFTKYGENTQMKFSANEAKEYSQEMGLSFRPAPTLYSLVGTRSQTEKASGSLSCDIGGKRVYVSDGNGGTYLTDPLGTALYSRDLTMGSPFYIQSSSASLQSDYGLTMEAGSYPEKSGEIAISDYTYRFFQKYGLRTAADGPYTQTVDDGKGGTTTYTYDGHHDVEYPASDLATPEAFVKKGVSLCYSYFPNSSTLTASSAYYYYKITGIVNSPSDFDYQTQYAKLADIPYTDLFSGNTSGDLINLYYALNREAGTHHLASFYGPSGFYSELAGYVGLGYTEDTQIFDSISASVDYTNQATLKKIYTFLNDRGLLPSDWSYSKTLNAQDSIDTSGQKTPNPFGSAISSFRSVDYMVNQLKTTLFWTGFALACFAGLLLGTFIASSITYQKRQIGILRALGARGADVYLIFWNESMMIALASSFVSVILTIVLDRVISNSLMSAMTMATSLFRFDAVVLAILLGLSVVAATAASFIPCLLISKKKPIDSINER